MKMYKGFARLLFFVTALTAAITFAGVASATVNYTYDNLGRLASAAYDSGVTIYYSYDLNGNRLTQVVQSKSGGTGWGNFTWGPPNVWVHS
jgi:YD repeat-containing protein